MRFTENDLKFVLKFIENKIHFTSDTIKGEAGWNLFVNGDVEELLNGNKDVSTQIRYVIAVLDELGYIVFNKSFARIERLTPSGYRFLFRTLYGIDL